MAESKSGNTSGQGSLAVIPHEIKGWNWGAFLLTFIWGIGNNVWISLASFFIPGFNIVLGVKGNKWAWQKKKWDSIEHFKKTQRKWAWWGLGVPVVAILLVIAVAVPSLSGSTESAEIKAAKRTELAKVQMAMDAMMAERSISTVPAHGSTNDMSTFPVASTKMATGVATSLYPDYIRTRITKWNYSNDPTGTITQNNK